MEDLENRLARIERNALLAAKNIFTVEDLAIYLGLSPKTIRNRMDEIPHYKNINGHVYFKRTEIEEWQCGKNNAVRHIPATV